MKKTIQNLEMRYIKITELIKWPFLFKDFKVGIFSLFYVLTKKGVSQIKLKNGLIIYTDNSTADMDIFREVFIQSYFQNKHINYKEIRYMLDIGAHKGFVTLLIASLNEKVKIFSLEPEETNYIYLVDNINKNGFNKRVVPINKAILNYEGKTEFYITQGYSPGNTILEQHMSNVKKTKIEVPCTTIEKIISDYNLEKLDLIKMDIEGAEYDVIFNLDNKILTMTRYLHLECHHTNRYKTLDMENYLKEHGFNIYFPYKGESVLIAVNQTT